MDRNVRSRNYVIQKVMELYESELKPSEIAKGLKINSVQSLRHAIERHNREKERIERITSEIAEEKKVRQKAEQEKLENEAKQREHRKTKTDCKDYAASCWLILICHRYPDFQSVGICPERKME